LTAQPIVDGLASGAGSSIYTFLHAVIRARSSEGSGPVTFLCCDNLRDNGGKLKAGLMQYLEASGDEDAIVWAQNHVTFPCCMVDRITPRIDPRHSDDVMKRFGVSDAVTVMGESYIQWVLEDHFANGRPAFETVGVEIVDDVEPYEDAKIRVLNGGHTILTYLAALKGHHTYDAGILDPELREFFRAYETEEVIPAIGESPIDLAAYRDIIESRFSNQHIGDTVERICMDGVSKFPIFVLPTIKGTVDRGLVPIRSIHGIASWYVFMRHADAGVIPFKYIEPKWDWITPMLAKGQEESFAREADLWGDIPERCPEFVTSLVAEIERLDQVFAVHAEGVTE
jgi:D-arabinitol 4-dehydrogenase